MLVGLEPNPRHPENQSRTIPPQLYGLHTGLPDIPCRFKPSRLTLSTKLPGPTLGGPSNEMLRCTLYNLNVTENRDNMVLWLRIRQEPASHVHFSHAC